VEEQPSYVVEGERVALGPLRMDLVATYQRWDNDLEALNANGVYMDLLASEFLQAGGSVLTGRAPDAGSASA
jgi:hypothetical protein